MKNLMKQMQDFQKKMKKTQEKLEDMTVTGSASGDMITVVMNGQHEVLEVNVKPEVVNPDDVEMLQDLILTAYNDAYRKSAEMAENEMSKVTGGLNVPGLDMGKFM